METNQSETLKCARVFNFLILRYNILSHFLDILKPLYNIGL